MTQEVRTVAKEDVPAYLGCLLTSFLAPREVTEERIEWATRYLELEHGRVFAAFEDGVMCGTSRTLASTPLTVPGGAEVAVAAVTQVTVLPTHRRRGHLTRMMATLLDDAIERGEPVSMLIAAEWPIYGRFGFGRAIEAGQYQLDCRRARFRPPPPWASPADGIGTIELVDKEQLRELAPPVFDRHRLATPGAIGRDDQWWNYLIGLDPRPGDEPNPRRVRAVRRAPTGEVDGYVVYDPEDLWEQNRPESTIRIHEMITASDGAYRDLWHFLSQIDLVSQVTAGPRPVDEPLSLWLSDGRAFLQRERSDYMWVRLLDVPAALEARRYVVAGALVLEVDDPVLGRGGRFALEGGPDGAECRPTPAEPDLVLSAGAAGATYLGGTTFAALRSAGWLEERTPGAVARADALFGISPAPWCSTGF